MGRASRLVAEDVAVIVALHSRGIPQSRIAAVFAVEPATVHRVLAGWVPAPAAALAELQSRRDQRAITGSKALPARKKPSLQRRAHEAVAEALAVGYLTKQPCICGSVLVQAHHYLGYAPEHHLDIVWLCAQHHKDAHPNNATLGK